MLEIVDWLPTPNAIEGVDFNESCMCKVAHINKIRLFMRFQEVHKRLLSTRKTNDATRSKRTSAF
jgi:hypothetical protein